MVKSMSIKKLSGGARFLIILYVFMGVIWIALPSGEKSDLPRPWEVDGLFDQALATLYWIVIPMLTWPLFVVFDLAHGQFVRAMIILTLLVVAIIGFRLRESRRKLP